MKDFDKLKYNNILGLYLEIPIVEFTGIILLMHSAMERIFGYGLKFEDDFKHTHLNLKHKPFRKLFLIFILIKTI